MNGNSVTRPGAEASGRAGGQKGDLITHLSAGEVYKPTTAVLEARDDSTSSRTRYSSGLPTADWALSPRPDQQPGIIAQGELSVIIGDTGHGKSSMVRKIVFRNMTLDRVNWGFPDQKTLILVTEEELDTVATAADFGEGPLAAIGDRSVRLAKIGSSREAIGRAAFACALEAIVQAEEAGRHPVEFLPALVGLDYDQAVNEAGENPYTDARFKLAELMLRGITDWKRVEIEKWSGVNWADFCRSKGHPVHPFPGEDVDHKVAVIVTAQVKAQDRSSANYNGDTRNMGLYVRLDENGNPAWDLRPGDVRLLGRDDYIGDKQMLKNATNVLILHRPNPASPIVKKGGRSVVADPRAFFIVDKMRKGARTSVIPLAFSSSPCGRFGQWYDVHSEAALAKVARGGPYPFPWKVNVEYRRGAQDLGFGLPIFPERPQRSPLDGVRYDSPVVEAVPEPVTEYEASPAETEDDEFFAALLKAGPPPEDYDEDWYDQNPPLVDG